MEAGRPWQAGQWRQAGMPRQVVKSRHALSEAKSGMLAGTQAKASWYTKAGRLKQAEVHRQENQSRPSQAVSHSKAGRQRQEGV
jgi:hypothetical protein